MTAGARLERFALERFTAFDVERDADELSELLLELEQLALERLIGGEGLAGIEGLVGELGAVGHHFERRETTAGWASWFQETHGGDRAFWIHVERDGEDCTIMVLYDETVEASAARRRAGLPPAQRAHDERVASFYDRGLALVERDDDASLSADEALLLRLYLLETGVANGGLGTWLTNTEGRDLADAARDLRRVGATALAGALEEVLALVPTDASGPTDAARDALEAHAGRLEELDRRFAAGDESIALLTLDHLDRPRT